MKKSILVLLCIILMFSFCACASEESESEIDSYSYALGYIEALENIDPDLLIEYGSEETIGDYERDIIFPIINRGIEQYRENAYYEYGHDLEDRMNPPSVLDSDDF